MTPNQAAHRRALLIAEHDRITRRSALIERAAIWLASAMVVGAVAYAGTTALLRNDYPLVPPACPAGMEFTEWCGCTPPALTADC